MQAYLRAASTLSVTELPPATANSQFHPVTARFAGLHCTSARSLGRTNSSMGTAMGSNSELVLKKKCRFRLALHASHRSQLRSHMPFTVLAVVHAWSLGQRKLQNEQHNDEQSVLHGHTGRQASKPQPQPSYLARTSAALEQRPQWANLASPSFAAETPGAHCHANHPEGPCPVHSHVPDMQPLVQPSKGESSWYGSWWSCCLLRKSHKNLLLHKRADIREF